MLDKPINPDVLSDRARLEAILARMERIIPRHEEGRPTLGSEICKALGLTRVVSLSIECSTKDVAMLHTEQYMTPAQEDALLKVLRTFKLEMVAEEPSTNPPGEAEAQACRIDTSWISQPPPAPDTDTNRGDAALDDQTPV